MWTDRQIAVEETNYIANNILYVLYFYIFYIFLWLPSVVELNVGGIPYIPNIKSISQRTSKKSPDNLNFEQKIQVQGPYNSAKNHSTGTKFELKL
jgi:hypothetical protein